jgi:SpoVK/Ycf46/Vps4 family AAA+-type ATPase
MKNRVIRNTTTKPRPFKSSSDINNYNEFLLELDKKHNNGELKKKNYQNMDNYTETINSTYEKYHMYQGNSGTFRFMDYDNDPNTYRSETPQNKKLQNVLNKYGPLNDFFQKHNQILKSEPNNDDKPSIKDKKKVNIQFEINNIGDLLKMIETYPDDNAVEYNINMSSLHKIKAPLTDLNNMIGMINLKENIVDQILFYIQNLHKQTVTDKKNLVSNDFMHTVIYGPPGTGKTEVAKIMGSIFSKLGILSKGSFKKVTRSDLVAGYLGQTALKTRDVIKDCLGGVLFIDEAYALGSNEKKDSFSKECIDTLCEALSDHKDNLMVIIAGYETDLNEYFFNYNQGLTSRFTWRFKIEDYSAADLYNIFIKKVNENGWSISDTANINVKWFEKNKASFKYYGRDIETLFAKTKISHSRRVFCLDESTKKKITDKDIEKGFELYLKNCSKKDDENLKRIISYMYS